MNPDLDTLVTALYVTSHLGNIPPIEFEQAYAAQGADHELVGNQ